MTDTKHCKCLMEEEGRRLFIVALCVAEKIGSSQGDHQDVHGFITCTWAPCGIALSSEKEQDQCFPGNVGRASKHHFAGGKKLIAQ